MTLATVGGLGLYLRDLYAPGDAPPVAQGAAADADLAVRSLPATASIDQPAPATATRDQLPATLPPGIVLVSTQPDAQPPQATLLLDGQLQAQTLGTTVAGSALRLRGVTSDAVTLGLAEGPVLYTLPVSPAEEVRQRLADARAARLAERATAPTGAASGDWVVQRDADQTTPLPDAMKVTVRQRLSPRP
ncbi:hypothetical protein [uncultured Sphaerotilus sp.]|uniref:hypothetical protein n=1 Tax=uncultured Sphaerotilus sp. TaxID=474984 RepID=UPI0030CA493F